MYRQIFSILAVVASANAEKHEIKVGAGGALRFDPAEITAAVGDTLEFRFYSPSGPHNVVSGGFGTPCAPNANSFFSGDMDGDADGDALFIVDVTSTDPIYFYCSKGRHCQNGMVGAVNAPSGQSFAQYKAAAQQAPPSSEPPAVTGGTVTTKSNDDSSTKSDDNGSKSSTASSSGSKSATGTTTATTTTTGAASASTTGTTRTSSASGAASVASSASRAATTSGAASAAATTSRAAVSPNVASGRASEGTVLGGLAALLGGFVALLV